MQIDQPVNRKKVWARRILTGAVWAYFAAILLVWLLLYFAGDRWWLATMLLFGPRWIYGVPWFVLVVIVVAARPRLLVWLGLSLGVLLVPIMGLEWPKWRSSAPGAPQFRVLTCNVDGTALNNQKLLALIEQVQPDIVALQEYSGQSELAWPQEWHVQEYGELLLASRYPIAEWQPADRDGVDLGVGNVARFVVEAPHRQISFFNVHLESPREGLSAALSVKTGLKLSEMKRVAVSIDRRTRASQAASQWIAQFPGPALVAGDFNMPADSAIYRHDWSPYVNAFATSGWGFGYTKWTLIRGVSYGTRIDHVLGDREWTMCRCWVGPDVGSDHLPLVADVYVAD